MAGPDPDDLDVRLEWPGAPTPPAPRVAPPADRPAPASAEDRRFRVRVGDRRPVDALAREVEELRAEVADLRAELADLKATVDRRPEA